MMRDVPHATIVFGSLFWNVFCIALGDYLGHEGRIILVLCVPFVAKLVQPTQGERPVVW